MGHVALCRGNVEKRVTPDYLGYIIPPGSDTSGYHLRCMRDVYNLYSLNSGASTHGYGTEQLTIPVLFDKMSGKVVSNDPAQILLMLDHWAEGLGGIKPKGDSCHGSSLYPSNFRTEIEAVNSVLYPCLNNGVYCCWLARSEAAFQEAFECLQNCLNWLEKLLENN